MRIEELSTPPSYAVVRCSQASLVKNEDEGRQFSFLCKVTPHGKTSPVSAVSLVDSGATFEFINADYVRCTSTPTFKLAKPVILEVADGTEADRITEAAQVWVRHGKHFAQIFCYVTKIPAFDLILGMNWLKQHNPSPNFTNNTLTFDSIYCVMNCLHNSEPCTIGKKGHIPNPKLTTNFDIQKVSARAMIAMARNPINQISWIYPHQFETAADEPGGDEELGHIAEKICAGKVTPADFDKFYEKLYRTPRTIDEIKAILPEKYHNWAHLFDPREAQKLPPRRPGVDHEIHLVDPNKMPKRRLYGLTREETRAIKAYIDEMLGKGFIRPSTSPFAAPLLVATKPGGGIRICVDYRELNEHTIKNRNVPPSIRDTIAQLSKARIMTVLDVIAAFNNIRIADGHEHRTAFLTKFGLYEYVVMPFGLCNAPATFQAYLNSALHDLLDQICTAYMDDIIIFSEDEADHDKHVELVLERVAKAGLFLDIDKCKFGVKKVKYLGIIISTDGMEMDPEKVQAVLDWQQPASVKDVQSFLGFANFYRRFIKGFSDLAQPLTALIKDGSKSQFPLDPQSPAVLAFEMLKLRFAKRPILCHFNPDLPTWIESDASDWVLGAVLSQRQPDGEIKPVAFLSQKLSSAECNYEIYDKELLAIVRAFDEWRPELAGTLEPIQVLTDHQALQ